MRAHHHRSLLLWGFSGLLGVCIWFLAPDAAEGQPAPVAMAERTPAPLPQAPATAIREQAARAIYAVQRGDQFIETVRAEMRTVLQQEAIAPSEVAIEVDGDLRILVVGTRPDRLALSLAFQAPRVQTNGRHGDPGLARDLAAECVMLLDGQGKVLGFRFAEMPAQHRNLVRSLCCAVRGVMPADGSERWSLIEADGSGEALVGYERRTRGSVHRHKLSEKDGEARTEGEGELWPDPVSGWWTGSTWTEESRLQLSELKLCAVATFHASAALQAFTTVPAADLPAFDWDAPWQPADGRCEGEAIAREREAEQNRQRIEGANLQGLVAELAALLGNADPDQQQLHELREKLATLLRLRPEAVAELALSLRDPGLAQQLAGVLLSACGSAGTAPAQELLTAILGNDAAPAHLRMNAARSLFQLTEPVAQVHAQVTAMLDDPRASLSLQGTCLLLQGALCGSDENRMQGLLAREQLVTQRGLLVDWLEALGNGGSSKAVEPALRHLQNENPTVRAAALSALRKVESAAALATLIDRTTSDQDPQVRRHAVSQLSERREVEVLSALERALADTEASVRGAAIHALRNQPAGRRLLQRAANSDADPKNRRRAQELLAAR